MYKCACTVCMCRAEAKKTADSSLVAFASARGIFERARRVCPLLSLLLSIAHSIPSLPPSSHPSSWRNIFKRRSKSCSNRRRCCRPWVRRQQRHTVGTASAAAARPRNSLPPLERAAEGRAEEGTEGRACSTVQRRLLYSAAVRIRAPLLRATGPFSCPSAD